GELPAVDPDAQHEVAVVELLGLEGGGATAVDARFALGVQTPPPKTTPQIGGVDGVKAAVGIDVLDPRTYVERIVVLLELFVLVQWLAVAKCPLAFAALATRARRSSLRSSLRSVLRVAGGGSHEVVLTVEGSARSRAARSSGGHEHGQPIDSRPRAGPELIRR